MEGSEVVPCEDLEETEPRESCSSGRRGRAGSFHRRPGVAAREWSAPPVIYVRQEQTRFPASPRKATKWWWWAIPTTAEVQAVAASSLGGAEIIDPEAVGKTGGRKFRSGARVGWYARPRRDPSGESGRRVISAIYRVLKN